MLSDINETGPTLEYQPAPAGPMLVDYVQQQVQLHLTPIDVKKRLVPPPIPQHFLRNLVRIPLSLSAGCNP